jgi:hypothetical protein
MVNSNGNAVISFSSENNKKKLIHRLEEGEKDNLQSASLVASPERSAVVTSMTTTGEDTIEGK